MFNVTGVEVILLLLVALIVLGPEKLPDAVRRFGRTYGELKRMSQGFQTELRDALDEPARELRSTVQGMKDVVQGPVQEVRSTTRDVRNLATGKPTSQPAGRSAPPGPPPDTAGQAGAPAEPAGASAASSTTAPQDADLDGVPDELWDGEPPA